MAQKSQPVKYTPKMMAATILVFQVADLVGTQRLLEFRLKGNSSLIVLLLA